MIWESIPPTRVPRTVLSVAWEPWVGVRSQRPTPGPE